MLLEQSISPPLTTDNFRSGWFSAWHEQCVFSSVSLHINTHTCTVSCLCSLSIHDVFCVPRNTMTTLQPLRKSYYFRKKAVTVTLNWLLNVVKIQITHVNWCVVFLCFSQRDVLASVSPDIMSLCLSLVMLGEYKWWITFSISFLFKAEIPTWKGDFASWTQTWSQNQESNGNHGNGWSTNENKWKYNNYF